MPTARVVAAPGTATPTTPTTPTVTTAQPTNPAPVPTVQNLALPKISGKAKVGRTLKVSKGSWSPTAVTLRYQWLANGKVIKKATKAKLVVVKALRGKKITVKVTASLPGAASVTVRTRPSARVAA